MEREGVWIRRSILTFQIRNLIFEVCAFFVEYPKLFWRVTEIIFVVSRRHFFNWISLVSANSDDAAASLLKFVPVSRIYFLLQVFCLLVFRAPRTETVKTSIPTFLLTWHFGRGMTVSRRHFFQEIFEGKASVLTDKRPPIKSSFDKSACFKCKEQIFDATVIGKN